MADTVPQKEKSESRIAYERENPWIAEGGSRWPNAADAQRWAGSFGSVWRDPNYKDS
jgi:hypothetical protein